MTPVPMNPAAKLLSDLVKQFRALGHPSDEAIKMAEAMVRVLAESGPKMIEALRGIAANATQSAEAKLEAGLGQVAAIKLEAYAKLECGPQEVIHLGMLWVWDVGATVDNAYGAVGPRCPEHKVPLLYQILVNGMPMGLALANYGDTVPTRHPTTGEEIDVPRFLGPNGTFRCPTDGLLWPQIGTRGAKLGEVRAQATALLKHKLNAGAAEKLEGA